MSKIIRGYFYVNPGYVGAIKKEDFEIEFDNDDPEDIIDAVLQGHFDDFLANTDMGWVINEEVNE